MTKSALGKTVFKKAIRHENKIESLGKPAAKITGAGGIPAESNHYQKLPLYSEKGKARLTPPYAARKSPEMNPTQKQFFLNCAASKKQIPISY